MPCLTQWKTSKLKQHQIVMKNLTSYYPYYDITIVLTNWHLLKEKDGDVSFSCIRNAGSGREISLPMVTSIEGVVKAAATQFM